MCNETDKKGRLYENLVEILLEKIRNGELHPGDKLPSERQLSEEYHVSRPVVREALRSLDRMGCIESKVGGGTYIKSATLDSMLDPFSVIIHQDERLIRDLIEVRILLESDAAALAAKKITPEQCEEIEAILEQASGEVQEGGYGLAGENAFHNSIAKIADNTALTMIISMCANLLSTSREATLRIPGQPENSISDHRNIFEAIKAHSASQASKLMKQHLKKARKNFDRSMKKK